MIKNSDKYRIHRIIGIIIVPILLLSTITGFFRANHKWFWDEGYKKKKYPCQLTITNDVISIQNAIQIVDSATRIKNQYDFIKLKQEAGNLYYEMHAGNKTKYLVEANTGKMASPVNEQLASKIAAQYVKKNQKIKSVIFLKDYVTRKEKAVKPVFKVEFDNELSSTIFIDYLSGEIVEDIDDNRKFGMWMVKLHDFDFFNSKRAIASFAATGIVLVCLSGLLIFKLRRKKAIENHVKLDGPAGIWK